MSFRSAAYAVVARVFRLLDSNGFTRILFSRFNDPTYGPMYGFLYNDPVMTPDQQVSMGFEDGNPSIFLSAIDATDYSQHRVEIDGVYMVSLKRDLSAGASINVTSDGDAIISASDQVNISPINRTTIGTLPDFTMEVNTGGPVNIDAFTYRRWEFFNTGFTPNTDWQIDDIYVRWAGDIAFVRWTFTRLNSAVVVPATGNIANQVIGTAAVPIGNISPQQPLHSGGTGRVATGYYVSSTGELTLAAVGGTSNIAIGEQLQLGGFVLVQVDFS